jgi:alkanesulfonate monooxygenase SsuD/methylene tetrahydromethanopterin reductase-like flavin-dependent oxidoreductase (luciferase family)
MTLDFGLLSELTVPHSLDRFELPTAAAERQTFRDARDQVCLADEVGFSHLFHVEHHNLAGFSHSTSSESLLASYAVITKNLRLGFGGKQTPFKINHPIKIAEQVATLDQLSDGRAEFGTARGNTVPELGGFEVDPNVAEAQRIESIKMVVKAWEREEFTWQNDTYNIPPVHVVPKPLQQPHPPIWMANNSPQGHRACGRAGAGLLSFTIMTPLESLAERIGLYYEGMAEAEPLGKFINRQVACFAIVHCAESDELAREQAGAGAEWYANASLRVLKPFQAWIAGKDVPSFQYLDGLIDMDEVEFDYLDRNDMCIVGNPDTCIKKIKKYQATGATMILMLQHANGIAHEHVMRSFELLGEHVFPEFDDGTPSASDLVMEAQREANSVPAL